MISDLQERKHLIDQANDTASILYSQLAHIGMDKPELVDLQRSLQEKATSLAAVVAERREFAKHYVKAYLRRTMNEIPEALTDIRRDMKNGGNKLEERRESMRKAGVPSSDIMRLLPDFDAEPLKAKIAELEAECDQWERFNKSGLPEDLPANADGVLMRCI